MNNPNMKKEGQDESAAYASSPVSIGLGLLIVGASAGLVLYTKRTKQMLNQMNKVQASQDVRRAKGMTKAEWDKLQREKMKTRINEDDLI
mmetsp:Transcript_16270/g.23967  ORF Transcript_16270/g.23967 Transcript_16270/m.23967 type:complete len:90 (-) Transcript_16270:354-623(-)